MPSKACSMLLIVVVVNVLNNDCARFSSRAMAGREEAPREEAPRPRTQLARVEPRTGFGSPSRCRYPPTGLCSWKFE
jgi:hypothetical protein